MKVWRNNSLSLVMFAFFLLFWAAQSVAGWLHYNEDQGEHGQEPVGWAEYVRSGAFIEATFENWESEFLQMAAFVFLCARLRQKGSAESKEVDDDDEEDPLGERQVDSPGPVQRGGFVLRLYSHSLSLTLLALFVVSFVLHAIGGLMEHNEELASHGRPEETLAQFLTDSSFWFQSMQNWQSEFLAVGTVVVLSIFLREKDSSQSKRVADPHSKTGR